MSSFVVAILTYNHPHISSRCIDSILKIVPQQHIRITHNGSMQKHQEFLTTKYPDLIHLINKENKGYSGGFNFTLKKLVSDFEWIYFLTNDTELLSLGELPSIKGQYFPLIYRRSLNKIDSLGGGFCPQEEKIYHLKSVDDLKSLPEGHYPYVPGTAMLLHRDVWQEIGEMDEELHTYWEDVDYSQRIRLKRIPILPAPGFHLLHQVGKTCHKDSFYTNYLFQRNKKIISQRYS